jgi:DNA-binding MarR family transcriptional regulator
LTEKGKKAHDAVKKAMKTMESLCFSNFPPEEKLLFQKLLLKMTDNLER